MEYSEYLDIEDELEQLNDIEKELSLSSEQSKEKQKTAPVKLSYKFVLFCRFHKPTIYL